MTGYSVFAELIAEFRQLNVYRRFDGLTAKTLLYQQAEITHLEAELRTIVKMDKQQPETAGFDQCWQEIKAAPEGSCADYQRQILAEIQSKLKEYRSLQSSSTLANGSQG